MNYVCYDENCNVRVSIIDDICHLTSTMVHHNHSNHETFFNEQNVKNSIKRKCSDVNELLKSGPCGQIREIFNAECET